MKSLRVQLLLIFAGFILVSILTSLYTAFTFQKKEDIRKVSEVVSKVENQLLRALKEQENYFNFEISNTEYFRRKSSTYLSNYETLYKSINLQIEGLKHMPLISESSLVEFNRLELELKTLDSLFNQTISSILIRGFRNLWNRRGDERCDS